MHKEGYTVILAGGGAKGAYQIGAWKALVEEKIPIKAAAGASVGALNAAFIGQDDLESAERLWENVSIEKVVDIPEKLIKDGRIHLSKDVLTDPKIITSAWKKGILLDSTPLKQLIETHLNEEKIRKRNFDLGVITVNRSELKPEEIFLSDIDPGMLKNYLLASSALPVFKSPEIKGKKYLDGAFYDNIPFQMMKNRGYRRFIIIDISGLGVNRKPDITGTETIYIKNSIDIGGILDFNPGELKTNRLLGYLDTHKILGNNLGLKYFYKPQSRKTEKLHQYLDHPDIQKMIREGYGNKKHANLRELLPREYKYWPDPVPALVECAALALKIPRIKLYTFEELITLIHETYTKHKKTQPETEHPVFQDFFNILRLRLKTPLPDQIREDLSPYQLIQAGEIITGTSQYNMEKKALIRIFPELPAAFIFFEILKLHFHKI